MKLSSIVRSRYQSINGLIRVSMPSKDREGLKLPLPQLKTDSYQRMKASYKEEIQRLQTQVTQLKTTDTGFMKYCYYSISLLGDSIFTTSSYPCMI